MYNKSFNEVTSLKTESNKYQLQIEWYWKK